MGDHARWPHNPATDGPWVPWWKERVVRHLLGTTDQPIIWCDDEFEGEDPESSSLVNRGEIVAAEFPGRVLAVQPNPAAGLTPGDLARMRRWIDRRTAQT